MAALDWVLLYIGLVSLVILFSDGVRRFWNIRWLLRTEMVTLELTPPAVVRKSPKATEELYRMLHSTSVLSNRHDRLLGRESRFSLEVISSRTLGIRYTIHLPKQQLPVLKKQLAAYLPAVHFMVVDDYLRDIAGRGAFVMEFKQLRHYGFPLATQPSLVASDPIAFLTAAMTKLNQDELVCFQLVLSPRRSRRVSRIRHKLAHGTDPNLYHKHGSLGILLGIIAVPIWLLARLLELITYVSAPKASLSHSSFSHTAISPVENSGLLAAIDMKLAQPLFATSIRALYVSEDPDQIQQTAAGLMAALSSFSVAGHQELVTKQAYDTKLGGARRWLLFTSRLLSPLPHANSLLAVSEISSLYHFVYGDAQVENTVKATSKTLPAPIAMKQHESFDVVLGENQHHGAKTAIGLSSAERERHVYIVGGTGNGKTTMLEYAIVQDIQRGKGVAFIDPHGDSASKLLSYIPKARLRDVIYLNPQDLEYPIGLNLLELPTGVSGSELAHQKDLITEAIISLLRKIFADKADSNAYRLERILRNAIHTALGVEDATLFTVLRLLTDVRYRNSVVAKLPNDSLRRFWQEELGKAGDMQRVKLLSGPISRLERYERSESARRMLSQSKSTINFDDIIADHKILICNFSKGRLGEDTSNLFGATVLAKLQLAAWRRDRLEPKDRAPFYLYVDEFQNFASESFMGLFSEARKYKLFMTIAQQSMSQLPSQTMTNIILDNVGTIVAFRSKSPATEQLLMHIFQPHLCSGEIANLPSYHFYIKVSALASQEPMSGLTLLLTKPNQAASANQVILNSRKQYGICYDEETIKSPSTDPLLQKSFKVGEHRRDYRSYRRRIIAANRE